MTEAEWQRQVIQYATLRGWRVHHTRPARVRVRGKETYRTPIAGHAGFPDLVLARRGRLLLVELKRDKGQLHEDQICWRSAITGDMQQQQYSGWHCWRPRDWAIVEEVLR